MRTAIVAIVLLLFACAEPPPAYEAVHHYDPARDAAKDIDAAVAEAARSGRRVLLEVGGEWCIWCHRLDALWQEYPNLAEQLEANFVMVKVNFSPDNENRQVLSRYPEIPGYPHFFVLDADGSLLHSQGTGQLETDDHHDPEKVLAFLTKWAPAR
ncbi:MAG: thioredoxin family protein [Acidobacteria bacterium]|nr:thioredoxin family protein [Acidobacteriota bacterium]MDA1235688.1 thioredoxin family protein [Acidobacteriota bacterium]